MQAKDVCAVIYAVSEDSAASEVALAVRAQTTPPGALVVKPGTHASPSAGNGFSPRRGETALAAGLRAGMAGERSWIWLLDGRAVPSPGALEGLLAAHGRVTDLEPVLLSSKVVDGDGRLHPDATPRHEVFEKARSVDAAERHLVQLRTAAHGSVLVAAAAARRHAPPRSDLPPELDMHEWSARLLRSGTDTGYLAAASVAVRATEPTRDRPSGYWAARARVTGSPGWTMTERLWEIFLIGQEITAVIRERGPQGRAGVGAPGAKPSRSPRRMTGITRHEKRL